MCKQWSYVFLAPTHRHLQLSFIFWLSTDSSQRTSNARIAPAEHFTNVGYWGFASWIFRTRLGSESRRMKGPVTHQRWFWLFESQVLVARTPSVKLIKVNEYNIMEFGRSVAPNGIGVNIAYRPCNAGLSAAMYHMHSYHIISCILYKLFIKWLGHSDTAWHHSPQFSLGQIMSYHWFGAKTLSESILTICQRDT